MTLINQKSQDGAATGEDTVPQKQPAAARLPETPAKEEPDVDSFGQLRISNAGNENYVGATHWSNILKEIEEVKESLEDDDWAQDIHDDEWDNFSNLESPVFMQYVLTWRRCSFVSHIRRPETYLEIDAHPGVA